TREWAAQVWDRIAVAGEGQGLENFGYRALESLRLEKGYRYYGTDLTAAETPDEAGLGAFVRTAKPDFIGRTAIVERRAAGLVRRLRTVLIGGSDYVPAYGGEAVRMGGEVVGRLRSVAYGPTVGRTVGTAYLPVDVAEGAGIEVDVLDGRTDGIVAPDVLVDPEGLRLRG
ncbi:MAG TPA: glycine cleavage T C-terminal barrel domain-containing protein, partial [Candidatus Binatia bacterium]|nr:glycine cleavage T C-terminal barrel domain-containing protein [Candidatus Binatia bacterium]